MMCFNPKFLWGPNLSFFSLGPWAIIHGMVIHGIAKYIYFPYHLKGKNWIHGIEVMAVEKVPKPLIKRMGGVINIP